MTVGPGNCDIDFARIFFRRCDELTEAVGHEFWMRHQRGTRRNNAAHGHKIAHRIIRQLLVEAHVHDMRTDVADRQRRPVGRSAGGGLHRENTVDALTRIDHHVLSQRLAQARRDQTPGKIRRPAWRRGHQQTHRARGQIARRLRSHDITDGRRGNHREPTCQQVHFIPLQGREKTRDQRIV